MAIISSFQPTHEADPPIEKVSSSIDTSDLDLAHGRKRKTILSEAMHSKLSYRDVLNVTILFRLCKSTKHYVALALRHLCFIFLLKLASLSVLHLRGL